MTSVAVKRGKIATRALSEGLIVLHTTCLVRSRSSFSDIDCKDNLCRPTYDWKDAICGLWHDLKTPSSEACSWWRLWCSRRTYPICTMKDSSCKLGACNVLTTTNLKYRTAKCNINADAPVVRQDAIWGGIRHWWDKGLVLPVWYEGFSSLQTFIALYSVIWGPTGYDKESFKSLQARAVVFCICRHRRCNNCSFTSSRMHGVDFRHCGPRH